MFLYSEASYVFVIFADMSIELDMLQTMAVGILALLLGEVLNRRIRVLKHICIPSPVTGGLIFSLVTLALYKLGGIEISFNGTLKDICMIMFFTTVGFQSDLKVLKKGGKPLVMLVIIVALLITVQNLVGVGLAKALGISPLVGMAAGSITMCGGHGTAAGFSALMEAQGLPSATTVLMAAATFGLVGGSLLGGPLAGRIIRRKGLADTEDSDNGWSWHEDDALKSSSSYAKAVFEIFLAAGIGTLVSKLLALTGLTFPTYFGALITAVVIRNVSEHIPGCPRPSMVEISSIGGISLMLFLGMAMVSLRLWELSGIALPLLLILAVQVVVIAFFARFVAFPLLGRNYDAAVLVGGICGFGLGATPNAMANMSAVCSKYRYAPMPFIIIPIVGAMFVDIINIGVITLFLNLL